MEERLFCKQDVVGSTPARGSSFETFTIGGKDYQVPSSWTKARFDGVIYIRETDRHGAASWALA